MKFTLDADGYIEIQPKKEQGGEKMKKLDEDMGFLNGANFDPGETPKYLNENPRLSRSSKAEPDGNAANDEPPELIFDDGDTLADNAKPPEFIVNDILETDSHGVVIGASSAFKTFLALKLAHSICTRTDFFGHKVFTTGKVLYVCGEGKGALSRRIKALKITEGDFNGNLLRLTSIISIDDPKDMRRLRAMIEKHQPVLVIFDTFASLVSETDENKPSEVGRVLRLIKETCRTQTETSSLVIHHLGKDATKGARGASSFFNDVDFQIELSRNEAEMIIEVISRKMKDGELFERFSIKAHVVELGIFRQDGKMATSLVMKASDEKPKPKEGRKKNTNMNTNEGHILTALAKVVETHGIEPSSELKDQYGGFNSWVGKTRKVVKKEHLKTYALNMMVTNSERIKTKEEVFYRAFESLTLQGVIKYFKGYAWQVFSE